VNLISFLTLIVCTVSTAPAPGPNVALGRPYTPSPAPNYRYCTDPGDATQLTDGKYTEGHFWTQPTTVGWSGVAPVWITLDLGKVTPIIGCSYSTAAGIAGVGWPRAILILVSDDGKTWFDAGDLVAHALKHGAPPDEGYATYRFVADDLRTYGRYFRLRISPSGAYTFCDEIEVYEGPKSLLNADRGKPITDPADYYKRKAMATAVRTRLKRDLSIVQKALVEADIPSTERAAIEQQVNSLNAALRGELPPFGDLVRYRAIAPLVPLHARIFATMARLRRAEGWPEFFAWHVNRYDMLTPMQLPERAVVPPSLSVAMMDNEYRADILDLTNLTKQKISASINIEGLPGGTNPDYITVHQVEFVEVQLGMTVADALPVARRTKKGWHVTILPGMTRQIWLSFHPQGVEAGTYRGQVVVNPIGRHPTLEVPVTLRIYPFHFPDQPTCSLGLWDYSGDPPSYDLTDDNVHAAIADMRAHFVDTPWGTPGYVPWPAEADFDAAGRFIGTLDFSRFDTWIKRWPGARNYALFMNVPESLGGIGMNDPRFATAVRTWLEPFVAHIRELGLKPSQFYLLVRDEPYEATNDRIILAWARAIKAAQPELNIWEDPCHNQPENAEVPEMFEACDVLCPNLGRYGRHSEASRRFYQELRARGKKLWFYQCSGPVQTFDPYHYERLQHWYCWLYGAVGSGFWAYGDAAKCGTSWNPLIAPRNIYTPVYIDPTSITGGKHFEAIREGIEDYEYLVMLRDRIAQLRQKGVPAQKLADAEKMLMSAPLEVCGKGYEGPQSWKTQRDRTKADRARLVIIETLMRLRNL